MLDARYDEQKVHAIKFFDMRDEPISMNPSKLGALGQVASISKPTPWERKVITEIAPPWSEFWGNAQQTLESVERHDTMTRFSENPNSPKADAPKTGSVPTHKKGPSGRSE